MALDIKDQEHLDKVKKFATEVGALPELERQLDYLATYAQPHSMTTCRLYADFAPHSFYFELMSDVDGKPVRMFNGGLIYSGPGVPSNGSFPSLTVSLDRDASSGRTHRWSVHT